VQPSDSGKCREFKVCFSESLAPAHPIVAALLKLDEDDLIPMRA
jgi:hypothetical protein